MQMDDFFRPACDTLFRARFQREEVADMHLRHNVAHLSHVHRESHFQGICVFFFFLYAFSFRFFHLSLLFFSFSFSLFQFFFSLLLLFPFPFLFSLFLFDQHSCFSCTLGSPLTRHVSNSRNVVTHE